MNLARTLGIARSLALYYGGPFRMRRMRKLYAGLVPAGGLCFDIGAHVGNRLRCFRSMGARVVALEPQPDFARILRRLYGGDPGGAGDDAGRAGGETRHAGFVKIDVEGLEPAVLAGLSRSLPALSFEFLPAARDQAAACIRRLESLGEYRYNWSFGETSRFGSAAWVEPEAVCAWLAALEPGAGSGDLYACAAGAADRHALICA